MMDGGSPLWNSRLPMSFVDGWHVSLGLGMIYVVCRLVVVSMWADKGLGTRYRISIFVVFHNFNGKNKKSI